jgi:hypothetical protein
MHAGKMTIRYQIKPWQARSHEWTTRRRGSCSFRIYTYIYLSTIYYPTQARISKMVWQIDLSGKCMIVSGGNRVRPCFSLLYSLGLTSKGIGLAISHQIAQAGAHVAIIYKSSKDAPERAKEISEKYGVHCEAFQCDVSDQAAVQELVGRIYKDVGPVGGVVCSAGMCSLRMERSGG